MLCTRSLVHSLAIIEVTDKLVFLVAVGIVAVLEVVNVKVTPVLEGVIVEVASTCEVAIVIVATAPEVVDVKVAVFPKVVVVIGRLYWRVSLLGQPVVECN